MHRKIITFLVCLLAWTNISFARTIKGTVLSAIDNEPIIGATILCKGLNVGTSTNVNGEFSFDVPDNAKTIVVSYVGMQTVEKPISSKMEILMESKATNLDEVVVIGYGTTTKKEVTGSVASISREDLKVGNFSDPIQMLQGQVAGLNIARPDGGDPTAGFEIQLRGLTTMKGGSSPLIIIDGVEGGSLSSINPNDIETIDVLKDGSAAAIYGTRGTNGVILVTTRKGKAGTSVIELETYWTTQSISRKPEFMSASEFRDALKLFYPNQADALDYGSDTDWFDEVTESHPLSQYYSLASSGGSDKLTYRGNISWHEDKGIVKNSGSQKLRIRLNVSQKAINDRLQLNYNVNYSTTKQTFSGYDVMKQAIIRNPTEPIYDTEGLTPISGGYYYNSEPFKYYNPVAMQNESTDEKTTREFAGSIHGTFTIIDGLKINAIASLVESNSRSAWYQTRYYPIDLGTNGKATATNYLDRSKQFEVNGDFNRQFGSHKVQAIAGYSYYDFMYENYYSMNYGFDTDYFSYHNMAAGAALASGKASMSSTKESNKLISFFGRIMYNYADKYLLSASVRHEGSSRFGANNKWGNFPAVSLGWRINQEEFMKGFNWVDELKLRVGYGVTGNQDISNYQSLALLSFGTRFLYNGNWVSTAYPASNPNPDLKWERKEEYNVGIDFSVLNSRIRGTLDYYVRHTKDLLNTYTVPVPPNVYNTMFANVGQINNSGIELTLNTLPIVTRDFTWGLNFTIAHNTNKLASFSNKDYEMVEYYTGYLNEDLKVYTQRIVEGQSIGQFYGPKWLGLDKDGNNIFEDLDGDGALSDGDNQVIGNAYPDFTFSIQNNFRYKNFDLSFLWRGSVGNDVFNMTRLYYEGISYFGSYNVLKSTLDYPEYTGSSIYSSRYIEDGSYLKLDNLTFGYNVPLKSKWISKLRVYLTGQNLWTITKYKGIDPEVHLSGLEPGIEWYTFYPRTRSYLFGINLTF
jgi:TonB-linked SusC/RagA family outer membrane protein